MRKKMDLPDLTGEKNSSSIGPPAISRKRKMISFALREMEVSKERGDKYFVVAMRYLSEGNNGDISLALENVNQKMDQNVIRAALILGLEELRKRLTIPSIESRQIRRPLRTGGESGSQYIHRLLNAHPDLFKEQLRLHSGMFIKLVDLMIARKLLSDGRFVKVAEQVGICIFILAKGASYRDAADVFKHSLSTICKYFKKVLEALVILSFDIVRPHADLSLVPPEIRNNSLYWPFFEDCVGALDGTHIQAVISDSEGIPFRGRKGTKTWNVLACCSFDRIFTFINVGWEGSVHDTTVWVDSLTQSKYCFPHPPNGKYYLVDSGYPNTTDYLSPIKDTNVRYHIPDFKKKRVLKGMSEQFNYRHSSLQTTVERAFGQLKKRWKILYVMPQWKTHIRCT
ncbi:hypothetical protein OROMI_020453 [Orobanche minor]